MPTWIERELTTLAFLWRLERRDGVAIGFTSHDNDLVVDGFRYRASPGLLPSAIERRDDLNPETVELTGAITSDAIRDADLESGRWDGAALRLEAIDWQDPTATPVFLVRGELGAVDVAGNRFSVELRGPAAALDAPVTIETSPQCRARLGDKQCRVDLGPRKRILKVMSANGAVLTVNATAIDGVYAFGQILWLTGDNSGLEGRIVASSSAAITLLEPPDILPQTGDLVELTEGCDKRLETCAARFSNVLNFRGEPFLPGNDILTRYGG